MASLPGTSASKNPTGPGRRANPDWDQAQVDRAVSTILNTDDAGAQQEILLAITASDEEWAAERAARGGDASSSGGV